MSGGGGPSQSLTRLQKEQLQRANRKEADARRAESASLRAIVGRGGRRSLLSGGTLPGVRAQTSQTLG